MATDSPRFVFLTFAGFLIGLSGCSTLPVALAIPATPAAADARMAQAQQLERNGQLPQARDLYTQIVQESPVHAGAWHRLGVVCTLQQDHAAASNSFQQALKVAPKDPELLTDAAYACYIREEYAEAEQYLEAAIVHAPGHLRANNNLGLVLGMSGRIDESLAAFERIQPRPQALMNLAYVYQLRGDWRQALTAYQQAQTIDPNIAPPLQLMAQVHASEETPAVAASPPEAAVQVPASELEVAAGSPPLPQQTSEESPTDRIVWKSASAPTLATASVAASDADPTADPPAEAATSMMAAAQDDGFLSPVLIAEENVPPITGDWQVVVPAVVAAEPASEDAQDSEVPVVTRDVTATSPQTISAEAPLPIVEAGWPRAAAPVEHNMQIVARYSPSVPSPEPTRSATTQLGAGIEPSSGDEWPTPVSEAAPEHDTVTADPESDFVGEVPLETPIRPLEPEPMTRSNSEMTVIPQGNHRSLREICLVTLHDELQWADADPRFTESSWDQPYGFASSEAAARFRDNPGIYVPAAGGLDVVGVRNGSAINEGNLDHAAWFRRRLYLFSDAEHLEVFRQLPSEFVAAPVAAE